MSHRRLHILVALLCTGLWAGAIWLAHSNGYLRFLDRMESALTDARTLARGVKVPPDVVTIVAIDDNIVKLAGTYPLPRAEIAGIVEAIARLEPKVIAVDLLLIDKGPAEGDAALAKSFATRPTVLAAAAVFSDTIQPSAENDGPLAHLPKADRFLLPLPAFADHTEVGIANVATGQTGTPLSVPMLFRTHDRIELSFPLRVASVAIGEKLTIEPDRLKFGDRPIATASGYALPLSYFGPRQTIRTVSAANLIDGSIDKEAIAGRIIVLGATATGAGDFFPTPFDSLMPGVEIISTAITHLVAGDGLVRDRQVRIVEGIITILLPMLLVGLLAWRRNVMGLLTVSMILLAWALANTVAFAHGIWFDAATTMAAAVPPIVLFGTLQLWSGRRSAQHLAAQNKLLEQFHTPGLQEWLTRDPDFLLAPVRQNAAVVFVDLSGFTSLSETLDPDATRGLLQEFHALVDKEVTRCGGVITSFLGDGVMILFGLPEASADDAARAGQCSIALCVKIERWIAALPPQIAARIGFKIGAHFGPIIASRLGGRNHQHITATGDTVNVASRLMEVAAQHDVRLALSDTLRIAAESTGARLKTGSLAGPVEAQIRGRSGTLAVWLWHGEHPKMDQRTHPNAAE
ncbi:adenylate/guanylate cyclase domain-containing protein [Bradyrhizobium sp. WSM 1738]|uniref:CHASE2 domain-containing protein n=1 Tax=Bradyrhizobium hereditatis TaxID=2821405 RepID=UPI001CE3AAD5|nr:adenylate/guanylate cyclase domain-containing protein [Bradyrhizobium hereditatis]MCA6116939.1 adenylate/guanylate cyclase domain-containing protein [Bradyrhizobium hereditatis]